jgi:phosphohistidine phosphatase
VTATSDDAAGSTPDPRRLVLVRHAKAKSDSSDSDRKRQLNDRGRADAASLGGWLDRTVRRVDELWSSSATRARQTTDLICAGLTQAPEPDFRDTMYDAGPDDLVDMVRAARETTRSLVLVGHNPTIERLQAWLTGDDHTFPTAGAAVIEVSSDWIGVQPGRARLVDFFAP